METKGASKRITLGFIHHKPKIRAFLAVCLPCAFSRPAMLLYGKRPFFVASRVVRARLSRRAPRKRRNWACLIYDIAYTEKENGSP